MTNKIKTISLVAASALLSSTAFSQITFSGYNETSFFTQKRESSTVGANFKTLGSSKSLGNETLLTATAAGKLPNGNAVSVYANFLDTDTTTQGERGFDIGITKDVSFVYGFDRVLGGEIVRTFTPLATNRQSDVSDALNTAVRDMVDVSSGQHAIGINVANLGMTGSRINFAYNPNRSTGAVGAQSSDDFNLTTTNASKGYSIGASTPSINGFRVGAGITKIDLVDRTAQDINSKTGALSFTMAPFAIGIQRTKIDGTDLTTGARTNAANTNQEDITDLVSATYAVTKDLTAGVAYSTTERTRDSVASPVDAKIMTLSLAYTMGPVLLSYDYEKVQDAALGIGTNFVSGNDTTANKLKAKVNF
jgi:hypothetical protein